MSITPRSSHLFAALLIALLLAAGGFGYWKSTQDRLPEGLGMGNGRLESTEVQIAAKIPGRLAEVRVDEGDKVLKGQLLARMDTRTLEAPVSYTHLTSAGQRQLTTSLSRPCHRHWPSQAFSTT